MGRHSTEAPELDWRLDRIASARRGEHPMLLARMRSGWAVMGDTQFLPGYCLLLADLGDGTEPSHLTDLPRPMRAQFLIDMGLLGEAMMVACNGLDPSLRRINYEILGNSDRYLHAHLFPRYGWEPAALLAGPVWAYPRDRWTSAKDAYSDDHEPLREAIAAQLARILTTA